MAGNAGSGEVGYVRHQTSFEEMVAFDALPAPVRAAVRNASRDWPAIDILKRLHAGARPEALVERIRSYEQSLRSAYLG
jgi:hypothetical protein